MVKWIVAAFLMIVLFAGCNNDRYWEEQIIKKGLGNRDANGKFYWYKIIESNNVTKIAGL